LFERPPTIPLSVWIFDVLRGAGERRWVAHFDNVIGDRLHDLSAAADVGVSECSLKAVAEGPVNQGSFLLKLARGRLARRLTGLDASLGKLPFGARVADRRGVEDQVEGHLIVARAV